ncbi:MAG TPA: DUF3891 family protein [Leptolyngbyaceae cyanobacterium]
MIVNQHQNGWEVIYHRAHALLAAVLAGHWRREYRPLRWAETIAAISHHDDLEKEWEGDHLTEAGTPLDFTLSNKSSLEKLRKLTTNSRYRGRWVAMLISMHMSFLNEGKRGESEELDRFLDEQKANQEKWQKELNLTKQEAEEAYAFMQWCDRLSLILCKRELPAGQRALEIATMPDGKRYEIMQRGDGTVAIAPWPFEEEKLTLGVEACYLTQVQFESNEELSQALQEAPIDSLEWQFVK